MKKIMSLILIGAFIFTAVNFALPSIKAAETIPTYSQYLADYYTNYGSYSFYKNTYVSAYRSLVETKKNSPVYQSLLGAWRVATFQLSDLSTYNQKEVGFYEEFIYSVLYEGYNTKSISGQLNSILKTANASVIKKLAEFTGEEIGALTRLIPENLSVGAVDYLTKSCSEIQAVMKPIGNLTKVFSYAKDVEELIYKLTKLSIVIENANETVKILTTMKNNTSNLAFKEALNKIIISLSLPGQFKEADILILLGYDYAVDKTFEYVLDLVWKDVISHFNLYGLAWQAGQTGGKLLTHALFSTDEDVELYYKMCALYEFEDQMKRALTSYESSYKSSKSDAASSVFNVAYSMLLKTHLLGIKAAQDFAEIQYKKGWINQLLNKFRESDYNDYTRILKNLEKSIDGTISFADKYVYNIYLEEYYSNEMNLLGVSYEPVIHTSVENANIISTIEIESFIASNVTIDKDITLTQDMYTYGDLYLKSGTLNLNGHTLTINGDLIQTGGVMNINGGRLNVGGDYVIAGVSIDGANNKTYTGSSGILTMTGVSDYVYVEGDFITQSHSSHSSCLTAGTMEIKGNFKKLGEYKIGDISNFNASGTHKVIFSGTGQQSIYFDSANSGFCQVEFKNPNIKIDSEDLRGFTLNENINLSFGTGKLRIDGTLNLNGHTLTINGDLIQTGGVMNINGGRLNVGGDYIIERVSGLSLKEELRMTGVSDYVYVGGDFVTQSSVDHSSRLSAGTMEIKGNFKQLSGGYSSDGDRYNFNASGTHKVIFSGTGQQSIYFDSANSGFCQVEFKNPNIKIDSERLRGFTLNENINLSFGTDKLRIDGTLNLNGHTLTINGDLIQTDGTMNINGGRLDVGGDYVIAGVGTDGANNKTYTGSSGILIMTGVSGYVYVGGEFITKSRSSHSSYLTAGTMEIKGNFKQLSGDYSSDGDRYNFNASGTHKVIFSGTGQQNISFTSNSSRFNDVSITNKTGPIIFQTRTDINSILTQPGGANVQNRENVYLKNKLAFENHDSLNAEINKYVGNAVNVIPTYADYEKYLIKPAIAYGDVNGDGKVSIDDLVILAQHIAEVNIINDISLLKNADVNGDGRVNIADLIRLSRWLGGNDKTPLGQP